ncbi:MAG: hypothetical protein ABR861_11655 [Terriglobales bacterium]
MLLARRSPLLRDFSARFLDWVNNKSKLRQASKDYMSHTGNLEIQAYWHAVRNAVGYNIYRGTVAGGPYSMINSSLDGTTAYTDNTGEVRLIGAKPLAGGRGGQTIGLNFVLTPDVRDREIERPGQFPADPIQGIKPRAVATVLAAHLLDHYFRV